jgi:general secretion pathway protein G
MTLRRINRSRSARESGFTLIELMVVIAIIAVLIAMAAQRYDQSLVRAREAALKQDLQTMRSAIQQFTLDKQMAPNSLEDLVAAGYLSGVPEDPMTRVHEWHPDFGDFILSPDQSAGGMTDVHSTSDAVSPFEHTPYSSW